MDTASSSSVMRPGTSSGASRTLGIPCQQTARKPGTLMHQRRMHLYQLGARFQACSQMCRGLDAADGHQRQVVAAQAVKLLQLPAGLGLLHVVLPVTVALAGGRRAWIMGGEQAVET